jgi:hypothetical protein
MKDLSVFSDSGFDPKAWINAACAGRQQDEPLERFLAELEMRLQVRPSQQSQVCSTHQPDVIDGCIMGKSLGHLQHNRSNSSSSDMRRACFSSAFEMVRLT